MQNNLLPYAPGPADALLSLIGVGNYYENGLPAVGRRDAFRCVRGDVRRGNPKHENNRIGGRVAPRY